MTIVQRTAELTWICGAYFYDDSLYAPVQLTQFDAIQIRPFATTDTQASALFGEATYSLTKRVGLTGGMRYSDERKHAHNTGGVYVRGAFRSCQSILLLRLPRHGKFRRLDAKGECPGAGRAGYVHLSVGDPWIQERWIQSHRQPHRPRICPRVCLELRGRDQADDGWRPRPREHCGVSYSDYQDLQVQTLIQTGVFSVSTGAATIKGLEVETVAAAGRHLQVTGQFSWLDATFDRFLAVRPGSPPTEVDVPGDRFQPHMFPSGPAVAPPSTNSPSAKRGPRPSAATCPGRGVDDTAFNDTVESQGVFGLLHLRAAFEPSDQRWELAFYARNLGEPAVRNGESTRGRPFPDTTVGPVSHATGARNSTIRR